MDFSQLIRAAKTINNLRKLIEQGDLADFLSAVGDAHFSQAIEVLRNLRHARSAREHVLLAVGHLQTAHETFRRYYYSLYQKYKKVPDGAATTLEWRVALRASRMGLHAKKDALACAVLAICYAYLGDKWHAHDSINKAREAIKAEDDIGELGFFGLVNPFEIPATIKLLSDDNDLWSFELDELEKAIDSL